MDREVRIGIVVPSPKEFFLLFVEGGDVKYATRIWQHRVDLLVAYIQRWHENGNVEEIHNLYLKRPFA